MVNPIRSGSGFVVSAKEDGMTKRDQDSYEDGIRQTLTVTVSRAQLLTAVGAGLALAAMPGAAAAAGTVSGRPQRLEFPFFPQVNGNYSQENILDILNLLDTFETSLVTNITHALTDPTLVLTEPLLSVRQARVAIGQYHIDYLESLGARPLLTTFTPRGKPGANSASDVEAATLITCAYMTAVREFAEWGQPLLAKNAFQAGATWAEIRGVTRALAAATGNAAAFTPALNKAFETDHFVYTRDLYKFYVAGTQFENSGASLSGLRLSYQGRAAVLAAAGPMASAVIQKAPNNAIVSLTGADVVAKGNAVITGERGDTL
jgi:hypothetical protein